MDESVLLPRECDVLRDFADHLHNTAKRLEEDEESGSKRYVYVKLGPDHFRHAFNYQTMAEDFRVPGMGLWEYMQAEHRELMKRQGRKQEPSIDLLSTPISGSTCMHIAADGTHTSPALMSTRMGGGE